jgi:hypothetical protein
MTLQNLAHLSQAIQSIILSLGFVIGGIWALFRYRNLKELEKANAELLTLRKQLKERGAINVELSLKQLNNNPTEARFIEVKAKLNNMGNAVEILDWSKGGILSQKINDDTPLDYEESEPRLTKLTSLNGNYKGTTLYPGSFHEFSFLIPAEEPGAYMVSFFVRSSPDEQTNLTKEHSRVFNQEVGEFYWTADAYIYIA